jgi:hypothetical protein
VLTINLRLVQEPSHPPPSTSKRKISHIMRRESPFSNIVDESTARLSPSATSQSPFIPSPKTLSSAGSAMWAWITYQTTCFKIVYGLRMSFQKQKDNASARRNLPPKKRPTPSTRLLSCPTVQSGRALAVDLCVVQKVGCVVVIEDRYWTSKQVVREASLTLTLARVLVPPLIVTMIAVAEGKRN